MAAADALGEQWKKYSNAEMVPLSVLSQMRGNNLRYDVSDLSDDLKQHGFREPGVIQYSQQSRTAMLGEGNHRLEAAIQAGMTHMPVRVMRYNMEGPGVPVRGVDPDRSGYVPGDLKPSEIMDWDD